MKAAASQTNSSRLQDTFVVAEHLHAGLCVRVVGRLEAEFGNS